ncbi:MAG: hypothetical protein ACREFO_16055, partial [Acetobacteraceae bacterium]
MSAGPLTVAAAPRRRRVSRISTVVLALWGVRALVVALVVAGTIGTIIKDRYTAAQWFEFVMSGLTIGSLYAQVALGYTMVYGVLR